MIIGFVPSIISIRMILGKQNGSMKEERLLLPGCAAW